MGYSWIWDVRLDLGCMAGLGNRWIGAHLDWE